MRLASLVKQENLVTDAHRERREDDFRNVGDTSKGLRMARTASVPPAASGKSETDFP